MTLPKDWADCHFATFTYNEDNTVSSTLVKPIIQASYKDGTTLNFHGVRASQYGMNIRNATHWGIFHHDGDNFNLLVSGEIPEPLTKKLFELSDGRILYIRRGNKNIKMSISMVQSRFKNLQLGSDPLD
jgi:hypothetical protein